MRGIIARIIWLHLVRLGVRRFLPGDIQDWEPWQFEATAIWIEHETDTREGRCRP